MKRLGKVEKMCWGCKERNTFAKQLSVAGQEIGW